MVSAVGLLAGAAATLIAGGPAAAAEVSPVPASGSWTVDGHGNGHGHGLSQYGARGAAIAGLSYDKILAFYYPTTTLTTLPASTVRVQLSNAGTTPTLSAQAGLSVTGVAGTLPTAGVSQYRLVAITGGFALQHHGAAGWSAYKNLLGNSATFRTTNAMLTLAGTSGARAYRGTLSVIKSGSSVVTVNTLSLDDYVRGVVPSEMPASWQSAAVQAQAVAARSYARYFVGHPRDPNFDICDTTSCQVYGGMSAEVAASNAAVSATANRVLTYQGATIFAEFSASNGGMTSSGNQPYFVTKLDPYDNAASGDPYLNWTETVPAVSVAAHYGLRSVTALQITARAGGGQWGGLVTSAIVNGTSASGAATTITDTGVGLASAMGLSYTYFHIRTVLPIGHLDSMTMHGLHTLTLSGWAMDLSNTGASNSVAVLVDGARTTVPANRPRPDVQQAYHASSPNHGFSASVTVPGGTHRVCANALSLAGADVFSLGCRVLTVPVNPIGHVDSLTYTGHGSYQLQGWTFDPDDNGGPSRVHVYVDAGGYSLPAGSARPDVQKYYGLANDLVGFKVSVPVSAGKHRLCAYGINDVRTSGANQTLQCWTVTR